MANVPKQGKSQVVKYNKWGYIFLIPFVLVYLVFQMIPLITTVYNSFFENYLSGLKQIGPNFIGFANYKDIITNGDLIKYTQNTLIMWILGFVPQIFFSLLLGAWFSDQRLRIRCAGFFKSVIYLPNLIMAASFAMLFFTLFADSGPINTTLVNLGWISQPYKFLGHAAGSRGLVAFMNFLMWFGNTTILLYVMITSLIGGLQMFDVPQVLTNGKGEPVRMSMTLIMYLNNHLYSKNFGMAGALSVFLFIITGILSLIVYKFSVQDNVDEVKPKRDRNKR